MAEAWKILPFDKTLQHASMYCTLVNAALYDTLRCDGKLEKLYRGNKLFKLYQKPKFLHLHDDILSIVIEYFNEGDVDWVDRALEEAKAELFDPFPANCSPAEFWDWHKEFILYKIAKKQLESVRAEIGDIVRHGYNVLDEYFRIFCAEHFTNKVDVSTRPVPSWMYEVASTQVILRLATFDTKPSERTSSVDNNDSISCDVDNESTSSDDSICEFSVGDRVSCSFSYGVLQRFVHKTERWRVKMDDGTTEHYQEGQLRCFRQSDQLAFTSDEKNDTSCNIDDTTSSEDSMSSDEDDSENI